MCCLYGIAEAPRSTREIGAVTVPISFVGTFSTGVIGVGSVSVVLSRMLLLSAHHKSAVHNISLIIQCCANVIHNYIIPEWPVVLKFFCL